MTDNNNKVVSPRVAAILTKRLDEMKMSRSDFIRKFHRDHGDEGSRNHLFKILNGQAIIGERGLLPLICKSMGLSLDELIKAVRSDKIQAKNWAASLPKANKLIQEVATLMETMNKRDQEEMLKFAYMKAGR